MPSYRINKDLNHQQYFLTFTIKNFYYIFDRHSRWDILSSTLKYYQKNKNLKLHSFVFMLNHIHLIITSEDVIGFVKGYKSYTSRLLKENIKLSEPGVLKLFEEEGMYRFWGKTNMPRVIESQWFYNQKVSYIHNNPVKKNYVMLPEHWYWTSANEMCELKVNGDLDVGFVEN